MTLMHQKRGGVARERHMTPRGRHHPRATRAGYAPSLSHLAASALLRSALPCRST